MMNPDPVPAPAPQGEKIHRLDAELSALLNPPDNVLLFQCDTKQAWSNSRYNGYTGYTGGGRHGNFRNGAASTPTKTEQPDLPWWAEKSTAARNRSENARTSAPNGGGEAKAPARYPMSEWEEQSAWAEYEERKAKLEAEEELLRQQEEAVYTEDEGGMISRMIEAEEKRIEEEEANELKREEPEIPPASRERREILVLSCIYCQKRPLIIYNHDKKDFRVECDCGCSGPWGTDRRDAANGWHDAYFPQDKHPDFQ